MDKTRDKMAASQRFSVEGQHERRPDQGATHGGAIQSGPAPAEDESATATATATAAAATADPDFWEAVDWPHGQHSTWNEFCRLRLRVMASAYYHQDCEGHFRRWHDVASTLTILLASLGSVTALKQAGVFGASLAGAAAAIQAVSKHLKLPTKAEHHRKLHQAFGDLAVHLEDGLHGKDEIKSAWQKVLKTERDEYQINDLVMAYAERRAAGHLPDGVVPTSRLPAWSYYVRHYWSPHPTFFDRDGENR